MADVARPSARADHVLALVLQWQRFSAPLDRRTAALGQFELERSGQRIGLGQSQVEDLARQYLAVRIWGAPATIALYAITGWLIAMERTRGVLALQLLQNGLNVGLDLLFVLGFGWGVSGVAVASAGTTVCPKASS